jgi:hypothetical protein
MCQAIFSRRTYPLALGLASRAQSRSVPGPDLDGIKVEGVTVELRRRVQHAQPDVPQAGLPCARLYTGVHPLDLLNLLGQGVVTKDGEPADRPFGPMPTERYATDRAWRPGEHQPHLVRLRRGRQLRQGAERVGERAGFAKSAVYAELLAILVELLIREDVKRTVVRAESPPVQTEALVHFIAGALVGVLMWWLDGRMRLSVDEVNAYFRRLALPALKAARG